MKRSPPLVLSILLVACCSALTQDERFVEFPAPRDQTMTYDLSTVQMMQPGRFTIIGTEIDSDDVMRFELDVLDSLRAYCKRPDGKYAPPKDLFRLGPPDLPIKTIEVTSNQKNSFKGVFWSYPYVRLATQFDQGAINPARFHLTCRSWEGTEEELYAYRRSAILNGIKFKYLFDCKRGLTGVFLHQDDDPSKAITGTVRPQSFEGEFYRGVCRRVMREKPFTPE